VVAEAIVLEAEVFVVIVVERVTFEDGVGVAAEVELFEAIVELAT